MIRKSVAIGCILFGSLFLYIGYQETRSVMGGLRKTFSGGYSAQTMSYLLGGGVLLLVGLVMLLGKGKKSKR